AAPKGAFAERDPLLFQKLFELYSRVLVMLRPWRYPCCLGAFGLAAGWHFHAFAGWPVIHRYGNFSAMVSLYQQHVR
ncbi:hypothetical protein, partial [Acidithiobacillus sp.]